MASNPTNTSSTKRVKLGNVFMKEVVANSNQ